MLANDTDLSPAFYTDPRVGDILPAFLQQQALETSAAYCRAGEFLSPNTKSS